MQNTLIEYTKWLFKWLLIFVVVIGMITGAIFGWMFYRQGLETVVAIQCSIPVEKTRSSYREWFLIKKLRNSEKPSGLYRGYHMKVLEGASYPSRFDRLFGSKSVYFQHGLTDFDGEHYYFGIKVKPETNKSGYKINRKTLGVTFYGPDPETPLTEVEKYIENS